MSRGHVIIEHSIDQISMGVSFRRDVDEGLDELCESIQRIGLIHPPAVTEQYSLIDGHRRLAALRRLGHRVSPLWIVHGVSDKLSQVLAIRDEQTLRKALKPVEQASLYEELKALYAEDADRRKEATQFGGGDQPASDAAGGGGGRADSAPPVRGNESKSRVQAAKAVTGRDSRTMLEQVSELKRIAASDDEDPAVRQHAAEALIELNEDGKVNRRYLEVKTEQHLAKLRHWAEHPDTPDAVRAAAGQELAALQAEVPVGDAAKEAGLAVTRVTQLADAEEAKRKGEKVGWADVDPLMRQKHTIRRLVDLLRREHGWWDRVDPVDVGTHADDAQWELISTYIDGATGFFTLARTAREEAMADADQQ